MIYLTDFKIFLKDPRPVIAVPPSLLDPWVCHPNLTHFLTDRLPVYIVHPIDLNQNTNMKSYPKELRAKANSELILGALRAAAVIRATGDRFAIQSELAQGSIKWMSLTLLEAYLSGQCIRMGVTKPDLTSLASQFEYIRRKTATTLKSQTGLHFQL